VPQNDQAYEKSVSGKFFSFLRVARKDLFFAPFTAIFNQYLGNP
jgi:hypothetical protein